MVLVLHVWGPAFGLPSIDAECLAAITYFAAAAVPRVEWRLVASSPSAVPPHALPALHDTASRRWIAGFRPIAAYLRTRPPSALPPGCDPDLDADLTPAQRADVAAYTALLAARAAPLVALSLYVSSANWAGATRPAFSAVLPFPLGWTEPPAVRAAMEARAEHLGLSSLDTDAGPDSSPPRGGEEDGEGSTSLLFRIPESLRLRPPGGEKKAVSSALTPEQRARIRLDAAAVECLAVLADLKGSKRLFLSDGGGRRRRRTGGGSLSSLDCLAFGYLALMLVPDLPRPWLRETLQAKYPGLAAFVGDVRGRYFSSDKMRSLPWAADTDGSTDSQQQQQQPQSSTPSLPLRFAQGLLRSIPGGAGEEWHRWWTARRWARASHSPVAPPGIDEEIDLDGDYDYHDYHLDYATTYRGTNSPGGIDDGNGDLLAVVCAALAGVVAAASATVAYRNAMPFGAPVVRYQGGVGAGAGLREMGSAGAVLGGLEFVDGI